MDWATFWAIFSQTHLVTLQPTMCNHYQISVMILMTDWALAIFGKNFPPGSGGEEDPRQTSHSKNMEFNAPCRCQWSCQKSQTT
jgi:hypothetical protein